MKELLKKEWAPVLALALMFVLMLTAKHFGFVDQMHEPLKREPVQQVPWNDGGTDTQTSNTVVVSRDYDPIRPRMRI